MIRSLQSTGISRALLAAATLFAHFLCASVCPAEVRRTERAAGPGVTHIAEFDSSGPLNCNVLKVDLSHPGIRLECEAGNDRLFSGQPLADMCRRENTPGHAVVAAVNGDFWSHTPKPFTSIGLLVTDGAIANMPAKRSVAAITSSGKIAIGPVTMSLELQTGGRKIPIDAVNRVVQTTRTVLYTHPFAPSVSFPTGDTWILDLARPRFVPNSPVGVRIARGHAGEPVELTPTRCALHVPEGMGKGLKDGRRGTLAARIPQVAEPVVECIGGGPCLLDNGRLFVEPSSSAKSTSDTFRLARHPRTAIGVSRDGDTAWLVTVDGRQPTVSVGMTIPELAGYMQRLGCHEAMNLDGGGSTTMVVRGEVVNRPSDSSGPRTVGTALMVVHAE